MHIIQAGIAKSGNFWLHTILGQILSQANIKKRSFLENQPIYSIAQTWELSFPDQISIDYLDIIDNALFYRISNIFSYPISNIESYINSCSLVWTHSEFCSNSLKIFPKFDKRIYIIRDPRDVAISWSNFVFTPYKRKFYPFQTVADSNPQEYLNNHLAEIVSDWTSHVGKYLQHREELGIYPIFYERLVSDFDQELVKLLNYLEINLTRDARYEIKNKVSFHAMQAKNRHHLRKGTHGQWSNILSLEQQQQVLDIAQPLLEALHYPIEVVEALPECPQSIPEDFVNRLEKVSLLVTILR